MSDSATGPIAGFLFQFEKALLLLATLEDALDSVSVEKVDDVSVHNEHNVVLLTLQAKHSISATGTTFEDTSHSLWRTLEIWIQKLESGVFNIDTKFVCSTNKKIGDNYLIRKIEREDSTIVWQEINSLLTDQKAKLKSLKKPNAGVTIKKTIKLLEFVISKPKQFEIIKKNIVISDQEDIINKFLVAIHMSSDDYTASRKRETFENMYGWITARSKAKWLNSVDATFTKKDFDAKLAQINSNPAIVNAIFRKKLWLGSINAKKIASTKKELFVRQIEDIKRNQQAKDRKIELAVIDFIYHDIEMAHIIIQGNFTEPDFDSFRENCKDRWQVCFDNTVKKELNEYDEATKNDLAIIIFDLIMDTIQLNFQDGIAFNSGNKYIHNGTFLKLSNTPEIGWHPEWKSKYK